MKLEMNAKLGVWLLGASALALTACGGGSEAPAPHDDTSAVEAAVDEAEAAAADAGAAVEAAAADTAEAAGEAADAAEEAAGDTMEAAGDAMDDAAAAVDGAMDDAEAAVEETVDGAMDDAEAAADEAEEAVDEAAADAAEAVETAAADGGDAVAALIAAAGSASDKVSAETLEAYAALTGDPAAGRRVFTKCMSCHVVAEGQNRVGPSLHGIIGREAGSIEGFRYSDANANSGILWTEPVMFAYLEKPQEFIPGTTMAFPGLPSAQERADVIAYIKDESAS